MTGVDAALDLVVAAHGGQRREGQHAMARAVEEALAGATPLLVEAGTGTGKSFAYLVPAVLRAVTQGERIVVSTATLALQRQILTKDLPAVADALAETLPRPAEVALLKGWNNYACKHKVSGGYPEDSATLFELDAPAEHPGTDDDEGLGAQVVRVREWVGTTETGDRDELVPGVSDRAWRQVSVTKLDCLGQRCPMIAECFPERARVAAREADVVVTNHAMLGIAASGSPGILPEHHALVIDEAHELTGRSRSAATAELSGPSVERMARMVRRNAGVMIPELDECGSRLAAAIIAIPPGRLPDGLTPALVEVVTLLAAACREALSLTKPSGGGGQGGGEGGLQMARAALTVGVEIADRLLSNAVAERRDVLWCDERSDGSKRLFVAPLEVAGLVADNLFADHSVVLTSATLRIGGQFAPAAHDVGLHDAAAYRELEVPAPFDYGKQAIRYVAASLPAPAAGGGGPESLAEIVALLEASQGGCLGLFSSRRAAERAAEHVRETTDLPVLCQGEDSLGELVRAFREDPRVSLFGTLSLWQGVDVVGLTSRLVIIDRIPFPRPDDPVVQARSEVAAKRGANAFLSVSAAHAALLLAQGTGRLIRSTSDRGVVAILDSRIATARYGSFLLKSLPPMWPTTNGEVARAALRRLGAEANAAGSDADA